MSSRRVSSARFARQQNSLTPNLVVRSDFSAIHPEWGVPLYARKDAREPPAGPDPIITQSVVKSGGLESLTSVWPTPVTTSRAWETMMKSGLIDGKSDLCNYYSFLQVDVRPHRL